ncbi:MAG: hypothetical protein WCW44_01420 [archaeon]|jgi:hypothetical protein
MLFSRFDKILFVSLFFILGIVFFASALGSVDVSKPYHILQQISKSSTDLNSIDADGDGVIDLANRAAVILCPDGNFKSAKDCGFGNGTTLPTCNSGEALVMTPAGWGCKSESTLGQRRLTSAEVTLTGARIYEIVSDDAWGNWHYSNLFDVKPSLQADWSKLFDASELTYVDFNQNFDFNISVPDALASKPITVFLRIGYLDKVGQDVNGVGVTQFACTGNRGTCGGGSESVYGSPSITTSMRYSANGVVFNSLKSDSRTDVFQTGLGQWGYYCAVKETKGIILDGTMLGKYLAVSSTRSIAEWYVLNCGADIFPSGTGLTKPPSKFRIYEMELWAKE